MLTIEPPPSRRVGRHVFLLSLCLLVRRYAAFAANLRMRALRLGEENALGTGVTIETATATHHQRGASSHRAHGTSVKHCKNPPTVTCFTPRRRCCWSRHPPAIRCSK